MSTERFKFLLTDTKLSKNDKTWFPRWIKRYGISNRLVNGLFPLSESQVMDFSRELRDNGLPAWQRLQAVRALGTYRDLVLKSAEPSLTFVKNKLSQLAARERELGAAAATAPGAPAPLAPQVLDSRPCSSARRLRRASG